MLNDLFSIGALKPYIFWGLVILGLLVFIGYSMILDRKVNRNHQSKYHDRCKSEKTKYYD